MSEGPKTRRRWFSFSLRTLFVVVTLVCLWIGWNVNQVRHRNQMEAWIKSNGQITKGPPSRPWKSLPWMWSVLGVESVSLIDLNGQFGGDDFRRIEACFPEAAIYHNGNFRDLD